MLRPTAISVTVQKDYTLKVIFNNGETKIFDVKPYIKGSWYSQLKNFSYFSFFIRPILPANRRKEQRKVFP